MVVWCVVVGLDLGPRYGATTDLASVCYLTIVMTRSGLAPDDQTSDVLGSVDSAHVLCGSRVLRLSCTATLVEFVECPSFDEWLITQPGATTVMALQTESVGGSYTTVLVDRRGGALTDRV